MRQWMVDPKLMCRKHLLGEHVEHHMFLGTLKKGLSVDGYLKNNLFQPLSLFKRHAALVKEMIHRGYNHQSPIKKGDLKAASYLSEEQRSWKIDKRLAGLALVERCEECRILSEKESK